MVTIAVDAMGGDHAPKMEVEGAVRASRSLGVQVVLVGREEVLRKELAEYDGWQHLPIQLVHASEVVTMEDSAAKAFRAKRDSSIRVASRMVRDGLAQGLVSAGNTGAAMATAKMVQGMIPGVDRPALASAFPTVKGTPAVIIDVGANVDSTPGQLLEFAVMGSVLVSAVDNLPSPRVGLLNIGEEPVLSKNGLLTTVCYKIGDEPAVYALEGSIAVAGSLVQWLRDNLGLISDAAQIEQAATKVEDNGGAYIVPAFSGLFAPYWRSDARGALVGLTRYVNKNHLSRAVLESVAYQTRDVVEAMNADAGHELTELKVDGGMVFNDLLMQFQADVLGVPVVRPRVAETTALGAAYAAGLAVGFWTSTDEMRQNWGVDKVWEPTPGSTAGTVLYAQWKKAVTRTFNWVE